MGSLPAFHVHLDVLLVLGSVEVLYLSALRRRRLSLRPDAGTVAAARAEGVEEPVASRRQVTLFTAGMLVLLVGATWPVHDLAERYLYSVHMFQHLLFTLVAAPLLLSGTPAWLLRSILRPRWAFAGVRVLTKPLVAIVVYNGVLLFTHWPEVVNASVGSELLHFSLHVLVLASAIVLWWPVVSPLPELPPLTPPAQMLYVFINSLAPTIPASFLTFGRAPLYEVYESFPRIWGIGALDDQLVAGLLMKIGGGLLLWGVITAIFFRWFSQEQRDGGDALQWRTFETRIRAEMRR